MCVINHSLGTQCSVLQVVVRMSTVLYECVIGPVEKVALHVISGSCSDLWNGVERVQKRLFSGETTRG